jgi:hypothetical protein
MYNAHNITASQLLAEEQLSEVSKALDQTFSSPNDITAGLGASFSERASMTRKTHILTLTKERSTVGGGCIGSLAR